MQLFLPVLLLCSIFISPDRIDFQASPVQNNASVVTTGNLIGRWQVKFTLRGSAEKNLVLDARENGSASFLLLDTAADEKPAAAPISAAWSRNSNDRVSFSSEVELPLGTCCRETGTLSFKGNFATSDSITGKVVFVTNTSDDENVTGFRLAVGTFTAVRVRDKR
jgi:hypothetical protein